MAPKTITRRVARATYDLQTLAYSHGLGELFDKMIRTSKQAELGHRRFGKNFTDGRARYNVSAKVAAQLISLQKVREHMVSPMAPCWEHAATVRHDVVLAYGLCAALLRVSTPAEVKALRATLDTIAEIDYAEDIAA